MMVAGSTILCWTAAVLFWACNAIQITQIAQQASKWGATDRSSYMNLDRDIIEYEWFKRIDMRGLEYTSGFLKGAFWITFSLPIVEMAWVLSRRGTHSLGCNFGIMLFVLAGSWSKWFTSILWNGIYISFIQLANNFNLSTWLNADQIGDYQLDGEDGIGYRALEVNYLVTRGLVLIVNAVEWICLAVIFTLSFLSVMDWRKKDLNTFGGKWNALGLFIGILAAIEFVLEVVGVEGIQFAWVFFILYSALNRLILIPLWIIILGFQLPKATSKQFDSFNADNGQLELSEMQQQSNQNHPSNFTIGDDADDGQQAPSGPSSPPAEAFAPANSLAS